MSKRHIVESITSWRAKIATGGGNILAFWRPWPPSDSTEWEQENHCLLYGHLGGVMYLTTNTLGDTLVSVGQDRVAKLWRAKPQISHNSPACQATSHFSHCSFWDILPLLRSFQRF